VLHANLEFTNFPHDFDASNNFVVEILNQLATTNPEIQDVLKNELIYFSGCYTQTNLMKKLFARIRAEFEPKEMTRWLHLQNGFDVVPTGFKKSMWITFENRRPPYRDFQRSLSFDLDFFGGFNHYLPLWVTYIDFLESKSSWVRHQVTQTTLLETRMIYPIEKKFACAFINNPNPIRLRAINELSKIGKVDVFGRYSGNYINNKIEKSKEYFFSICFENDIYPGYVTEKPLEAWLGQTVPLYWGNDIAEYINPSSMINLNNFLSLNQYCDYVSEVYKDKDLYTKIFCQPFLKKPYDIENLLSFFKSWILE
jgi:hypothetical protein